MSALRGGGLPERRDEYALDIARKRYPGDNRGEHLERWGDDQLRTEIHHIEVVGKVRDGTTVPGAAQDAWATRTVVTDTPDVPR